MSVGTRRVNLDEEHTQLCEVLERNLPELPHALRFKWLYRDNPHHRAWSWFAYDKRSGAVVGVASVFPRAVWVGRTLALWGQVGDFAVDRSHRSLGPAVILQRATFETVKRGDLALCYDCPPHDRGMSTFHRLGMDPQVEMARYARLVRVDRQVRRRLGRGRAATSITALANVVVRHRALRRRADAGLDIAEHDGRFDDEFSILDRRVGGEDVIRSRRAAEDLNWRYREDPCHEYRVLTARRAGELVAFAVVSVVGDDAYLVDFSGELSGAVCGALCEGILDLLGRSAIQTLQAVVADGSALATALRESGFRYRAAASWVVAYAPPDGAGPIENGMRWLFRHADILA